MVIKEKLRDHQSSASEGGMDVFQAFAAICFVCLFVCLFFFGGGGWCYKKALLLETMNPFTVFRAGPQ